MPNTECRCNACGHTFMQLTFAGDRIAAQCPHCKSRDVKVDDDRARFMAGASMGSRLAGVPKGPS